MLGRLLATGAAIAGATAGLVAIQRRRGGGLGRTDPGCQLVDRGDADKIRFVYLCDGKEVGRITADPSDAGRVGSWAVEHIGVRGPLRRKGIGTKLYQAAAEEACSRGGPLVSDTRIGRQSEGFWFKQIRKGRAHAINLPGEPSIFVLPCPAPQSLARLGRLPSGAAFTLREERSEIQPPGFTICAEREGKTLGCITSRRADWIKKDPGPTPFEVNGIWVAKEMQRRGIATKLYEAAAAEACQRGAPLQSDMERSPEADRFWRKQRRKGRAIKMERVLVDEPVDFFRLTCPAPESLSGALGKSPVKLRCEPRFTENEIENMSPNVRRLMLRRGNKKCRYRQRRPFKVARFESKRDEGHEAIVHPSTKRPGKCQVTYFDDKTATHGPVGDSEHRNCAEAIASINPQKWRLVEVK